MLERLLLGLLTLGLPDQPHNWPSVEDNAAPPTEAKTWLYVTVSLQNSAKLRVGMLSISLIICLAVGGYMGYNYWTEKNRICAYARNLTIAFVCRTFFSILFDGVVVLGSNATVGGANALLAFEGISQNLVIAFWLLLTVYLHARVQRKFNSEPSLIHFECAVPGVAIFFALIWIFGLQAEYPYSCWWFMVSPLPQWIVSSLRLLYLLIQLGLVIDMGRMLLKISLDNDSVSLLRKSEIIIAALILLFWLQFGLSLGRIPLKTSQSYQYFDSIIDGSQPGLVCLALIFFVMWVPALFNKIPNIMMENEEAPKLTQEVLLTGNRGIETIDKVFKTKETARWNNSDAVAESRDVMYSTVVEPHRLKKTLDLYKRLNILPSHQTTILDDDQFYDCRMRHSIVSDTGDSDKADFHSVISNDSKNLFRKNSQLKTEKTSDHVQKKNAFYASKYLILDPKEGDFPRFLETRPSVASLEKESTREGSHRDFFELDTTMSDELVQKWLNDNSENLRGKPKSRVKQPDQKASEVQQPKSAEELSRDFAHDSIQQIGSQDVSTQQESASTIRASESENDINIEPSQKDSAVRTLTPAETNSLQPSIIQRYIYQAFKRKYSETDSNSCTDPKPLEPTSGEAVGSLGKEDSSEVHRETKRRKSTQDADEREPSIVSQHGDSTKSRIEPPTEYRQSTESGFTPKAVGFTPTPTDPLAETQFGGFSGVFYSTLNSLFNFGDTLFNSGNSASSAERSDLEVSSQLEDLAKGKTAMPEAEAPKIAEDNSQNLRTNIESSSSSEALEMKIKENLTALDTRSDSVERLAQEAIEEPKKPSIVPRETESPQKLQPAPVVSPKAEIVEDSSSESNFSIEKADSSSSSFSLNKYYLDLMGIRKKMMTTLK